jgi:DNA invertase Pin-like site-specific DNA recombinase
LKKTIIYIRTSTTEQNPENQLKDCISINKWGEYVLYSEQQSAFKDNDRQHFDNIIKLIKSKQVDHIICWDFDRLYRNRKKLISFFKFCQLYKCKIHSHRQQWFEKLNDMPEPFDEAMHDFMLHILGWIAEDESDQKSKRVKASVRRNHKGTYSYKGNKWGRKSVSTFKQNKILELRKQGYSLRDISKEVNTALGSVHKICNAKPTLKEGENGIS